MWLAPGIASGSTSPMVSANARSHKPFERPTSCPHPGATSQRRASATVPGTGWGRHRRRPTALRLERCCFGGPFERLAHFEVILRNALHEQLSLWHAAMRRPAEWYDDPAHLLDTQAHDDIRKALGTLAKNNQVVVPGKVVAELNFGFWRFLLDRRYQATLWGPCLRHAFPHQQPRRRADVYAPVASANWLRNRIAHHEPIHGLTLERRHQDLLRVSAYIDPGLAAWLSGLSRVPMLLASRPR